MSLPRTNSLNNINDLIKKNEGEKNLITSGTINSSKNDSAILNYESTAIKNKPEMKLKLSSVSNSIDSNKKELSPRAIPRSTFLLSPRKLKEKNEASFVKNLQEEKKYSHSHDADSNSPEKEKINEKNSSSSPPIISADSNDFLVSSPVLQIRRYRVAIPVSILNKDNDHHNNATPASPRSKNSASAISSEINNLENDVDCCASIKDSSKALVELILKEYDNKPLKPEIISRLGRDDIYFAVESLPKQLTYLCDFPDKEMTSISELIIAFFGEKLLTCPAWKKAKDTLYKGLSLEDGTVKFGDLNIDVKKKYIQLIKPLALIIADNILGSDGKISSSSLPVEFVIFLYQADKKILEICLNSKKLRIKDINNARLYFLFNLAVTRFLQVLIVKEFSNMPTQVECWLMSEILDSFGAGITNLFHDFMIQSGSKIPAELSAKFHARTVAEVREDEAIKKFKQKQLTQNRINELKEKDSRRIGVRSSDHNRATSNIDLAGLKFARDNNKILDTIKSECGFDEMDDKFIHYIEKNQKSWFHANEKNTLSHILISLKIAVRDYLEMEAPEKSLIDEKFEVILENLDARLSTEYEEKRKRRSTVYSKDIKLSVNLNNGTESKDTTASTSSDIIFTATGNNFPSSVNISSSSNDS